MTVPRVNWDWRVFSFFHLKSIFWNLLIKKKRLKIIGYKTLNFGLILNRYPSSRYRLNELSTSLDSN